MAGTLDSSQIQGNCIKKWIYIAGLWGEGIPGNVKEKADQKELLVLDTWAVFSAALGNVLSAQEKLKRIQLICC